MEVYDKSKKLYADLYIYKIENNFTPGSMKFDRKSKEPLTDKSINQVIDDVIYLSTQIIYYFYNGRFSSLRIRSLWYHLQGCVTNDYKVYI